MVRRSCQPFLCFCFFEELPIPNEPSMASKPPKGSPFKDGGVIARVTQGSQVPLHQHTTKIPRPVFLFALPFSGVGWVGGSWKGNDFPPEGSFTSTNLFVA